MTSEELKRLVEVRQQAVAVFRESEDPATQEKAWAAAEEARDAMDKGVIEMTEAREAEEAEARAAAERIANQPVEDAPAPIEPSSGQKLRAWQDAGSPGRFRIAVMPDYAYDYRAAGSKSRVLYDHHADKEISVEGRGVDGFQHIEKRTAADIEKRTQILSTDAGTVYSSYLVPARTDRSLSWYEVAQSGILKAGPTIIHTPDDTPLYLPKWTTDASATYHAEGSPATVTSPVLGEMLLNSARFDGFFSVSSEMIRSSILDIVPILQEGANRAISTAVATALASSAGTTIIPQGLTGTNTTCIAGATASAATSFTFDNLVTLYHSLLPVYRMVASWTFGTNAFTLLAQLKDDNGQYLWKPNNVASEPDMLMGHPVFEEAGAPDITTGTKGSVLCGDFSQYIIRYVGPVVFEASEEFAFSTFQTTFRFAKWFDADLIQPTAIHYLLMA